MTARFDIPEDEAETGYSIVNAEAPEPPAPSAPARAAASVRKAVQESARKSPTMTAYVAGILTGGILTLLGGLIR